MFSVRTVSWRPFAARRKFDTGAGTRRRRAASTPPRKSCMAGRASTCSNCRPPAARPAYCPEFPRDCGILPARHVHCSTAQGNVLGDRMVRLATQHFHSLLDSARDRPQPLAYNEEGEARIGGGTKHAGQMAFDDSGRWHLGDGHRDGPGTGRNSAWLREARRR